MCEVTRRFPRRSRWELALMICENLGWEVPNGQPRGNSCLVLPPKVSQKPRRGAWPAGMCGWAGVPCSASASASVWWPTAGF